MAGRWIDTVERAAEATGYDWTMTMTRSRGEGATIRVMLTAPIDPWDGESWPPPPMRQIAYAWDTHTLARAVDGDGMVRADVERIARALAGDVLRIRREEA